MNKTLAALVAAWALAAGSAALAHGGAPAAAWYGGQLVETPEGYRVEFAVREGLVRAWVRDRSDRPVKAAGTATLAMHGHAMPATLRSEGDALVAEAHVGSADKLEAALALTVAGKQLAARFTQEAVATPALAGPAESGKQAFDKVCATCHGAALRGSDKAPPLLHPYYTAAAGHTDDVMLSAMAKGTKSHMWKLGDMPKPEGLGAGQDKEVLAYIRAMQAANGLGAQAALPPMPAMDHSSHMKHHH
ncbi:MAG: c-type cytochrome [Actinomycetota bacterium]